MPATEGGGCRGPLHLALPRAAARPRALPATVGLVVARVAARRCARDRRDLVDDHGRRADRGRRAVGGLPAPVMAGHRTRAARPCADAMAATLAVAHRRRGDAVRPG